MSTNEELREAVETLRSLNRSTYLCPKDSKAIETVLAALEKAQADAERYESAIRWALGEGGEFPPREEVQGRYWWRTELRRRAALASVPTSAEHGAEKNEGET